MNKDRIQNSIHITSLMDNLLSELQVFNKKTFHVILQLLDTIHQCGFAYDPNNSYTVTCSEFVHFDFEPVRPALMKQIEQDRANIREACAHLYHVQTPSETESTALLAIAMQTAIDQVFYSPNIVQLCKALVSKQKPLALVCVKLNMNIRVGTRPTLAKFPLVDCQGLAYVDMNHFNQALNEQLVGRLLHLGLTAMVSNLKLAPKQLKRTPYGVSRLIIADEPTEAYVLKIQDKDGKDFVLVDENNNFYIDDVAL